MQIPEPRLNKIPFFLTDLACLLVAALIGFFAENPFAPLPLILITTLVLGGGVALLIPYLTDYAAECREATARTQAELEAQLARVQSANESLARAAAHIKAVEEAVHKSAREAETLPYRMQEKLAEFNEALAAQETDDREALERELEELRELHSAQLKAAAEKIHKTTTEWTALEVATRRHLTATQEAARIIEAQLQDSLAQFVLVTSSPRVAPSAPAPVTPPAPAPATPILLDARQSAPTTETAPARPLDEFSLPATASFAPSAASEPTDISTAITTPAEPALSAESPAPEPAKVKKPRPPRKPRPDDTLLAMSAPTTTTETVVAESSGSESAVDERPTDLSESARESETDAKPESSTSSDGATRLLATAYIGIGNKLFIRGDGPGLSWDRGVPMQFVSIGKWGWATHDAAGPVRIRLYKNDEVPVLTGELTLEPGRHTEATAQF